MENLLIDIKSVNTESDGGLSFFESNKDISFDIKRIYYIYDVPTEVKRGFHAHKKLRQLLWCPYGHIDILINDGKNIKTYTLDSPKKGLVILKGYWREMIWKKENSVLCVAASDYYNEDDYIRNYEEFLKYAEEGFWNEK